MADLGKVGVVTVTYNSGKVIEGFVASLLGQKYSDFGLYAVDNASVDDTIEKLGGYGDPRIHLIANRKNVGVAEGNNQGVRAAFEDGCNSILFVNNDTEFDSSMLESLILGLERYQADMIAPKIVFYDRPNIIWSAGGGFKAIKGYAGFHYGVGEVDQGQFEIVKQIHHAPTCCLLVKRCVFDCIGLMDSRYFVYIDDTDFCFRAMKAGFKLIYLPSAVVSHKVSSLTGGSESEFAIRYCTRNQIYFVLKNLGPWLSLYFLPEYQARLWGRLILGKISVYTFMLQQKAFFEGIRVWTSINTASESIS